MFGLSKNDMNPISDSTYVQPTYLPALLCLKEKLIMIRALIQEPKQLDNDIEVYLNHWLKKFYCCGTSKGVRT